MQRPLPRSTRSLRVAPALCTLALLALLALRAHANEGKWTPQQVLDQGPAWVKAQGFALPLQSLWDPKKAADARVQAWAFAHPTSATTRTSHAMSARMCVTCSGFSKRSSTRRRWWRS